MKKRNILILGIVLLMVFSFALVSGAESCTDDSDCGSGEICNIESYQCCEDTDGDGDCDEKDSEVKTGTLNSSGVSVKEVDTEEIDCLGEYNECSDNCVVNSSDSSCKETCGEVFEECEMAEEVLEEEVLEEEISEVGTGTSSSVGVSVEEADTEEETDSTDSEEEEDNSCVSDNDCEDIYGNGAPYWCDQKKGECMMLGEECVSVNDCEDLYGGEKGQICDHGNCYKESRFGGLFGKKALKTGSRLGSSAPEEMGAFAQLWDWLIYGS